MRRYFALVPLLICFGLVLAFASPAAGTASGGGAATPRLKVQTIWPADAYEPDDASATAKVVPLVSAHTFHNDVDEDWIKFTADATGTPFVLEARYLDGEFFSYLNVFEPTATISGGLNYLKGAWSFSMWQSTIGPTMLFTAPHPGTYYCRVFRDTLSSCPLLYTWDGSKYDFVSDVMVFGTLGMKQGSSYRYPTPVEETRVDRSLLKADGGKYKIALKNEQNEIEFVDKVTLKAVDHPAGTQVYLSDYNHADVVPATQDLRIFTTRNLRPPVHASYTDVPIYTGPAVTDKDITSEVSHIDNVYAPAGFFDDNRYTFDFGDLSGAPEIKLVVNGWTQYATPSERAAWEKSGARRADRVLEVMDAAGKWVPVDTKMPQIPGYTKSIVFDLTGKFPAGVTDYKVRMRGLYRTWFDQVAVDTSKTEPVSVKELTATKADLRFTGASAMKTRPQPGFSYTGPFLTPTRTHQGNFTKFGGVLPLTAAADDKFVVMDTGDELDMQFGEAPVAPGMERTYILHTDGFYQELSGAVDPMPFHAMSNYPYPASEHYPTDADHTAYLATWNTRHHAAGGTTTDGVSKASSVPEQPAVSRLQAAQESIVTDSLPIYGHGAGAYTLYASKGIARRISGADRYETAVKVSQQMYADALNPAGLAQEYYWCAPSGVILASGEDFPDALVGGAWSAMHQRPAFMGYQPYPVLLTRSVALPSITKAELARLATGAYLRRHPLTVYVIGGPGKVSGSILTAVRNIPGVADVQRISGSTRFGTASAVASAAVAQGLTSDTVFIANGFGYADAMSAAPIAGSLHSPVLLSGKTAVPAETAAWIREHPGVTKAVLVGDEKVLDANVASVLSTVPFSLDVTRVGGSDRLKTSRALAEYGFAHVGLDGHGMLLVTGWNFPDGLAAGPMTAFTRSPLLLTRGSSLSTEVAGYYQEIAPVTQPSYVVGGPPAVSDPTLAHFRDLWKP